MVSVVYVGEMLVSGMARASMNMMSMTSMMSMMSMMGMSWGWACVGDEGCKVWLWVVELDAIGGRVGLLGA